MFRNLFRSLGVELGFVSPEMKETVSAPLAETIPQTAEWKNPPPAKPVGRSTVGDASQDRARASVLALRGRPDGQPMRHLAIPQPIIADGSQSLVELMRR